jgi:hypothetical protein
MICSIACCFTTSHHVYKWSLIHTAVDAHISERDEEELIVGEIGETGQPKSVRLPRRPQMIGLKDRPDSSGTTDLIGDPESSIIGDILPDGEFAVQLQIVNKFNEFTLIQRTFFSVSGSYLDEY